MLWKWTSVDLSEQIETAPPLSKLTTSLEPPLPISVCAFFLRPGAPTCKQGLGKQDGQPSRVTLVLQITGPRAAQKRLGEEFSRSGLLAPVGQPKLFLSMVETWQQWDSDLTREGSSVTTGNRVGEEEGEEEEERGEEEMMVVL